MIPLKKRAKGGKYRLAMQSLFSKPQISSQKPNENRNINQEKEYSATQTQTATID